MASLLSDRNSSTFNHLNPDQDQKTPVFKEGLKYDDSVLTKLSILARNKNFTIHKGFAHGKFLPKESIVALILIAQLSFVKRVQILDRIQN